MNDRRFPYKSYRQAMSTASDPNALNRWRLMILVGESDYLLSSTKNLLKEVWEKAAWQVERLEGVKLNSDRFNQAVGSRSLFDPRSVTVLVDAHQSGDLLACLEALKGTKDFQNPMLLLWRGKDLSAKILKEVQRLGALIVPCNEPAPWELKDFVVDLCNRYKVSLTVDAIELLLDAVGGDLFKIDNELKRLSLTLGECPGSVNAQTLRGHLGFLREDHVFKLDQWLCSGASTKALLLLKDLMDRGEKPLGILSILAMHCRKALQVQSGLKSGVNAQELARQLRLPPTVVQAYVPYVQKRSPLQFQKALRLCHEADRRLKSRSEGEELWLSQIVFALGAPRVSS